MAYTRMQGSSTSEGGEAVLSGAPVSWWRRVLRIPSETSSVLHRPLPGPARPGTGRRRTHPNTHPPQEHSPGHSSSPSCSGASKCPQPRAPGFQQRGKHHGGGPERRRSSCPGICGHQGQGLRPGLVGNLPVRPQCKVGCNRVCAHTVHVLCECVHVVVYAGRKHIESLNVCRPHSICRGINVSQAGASWLACHGVWGTQLTGRREEGKQEGRETVSLSASALASFSPIPAPRPQHRASVDS